MTEAEERQPDIPPKPWGGLISCVLFLFFSELNTSYLGDKYMKGLVSVWTVKHKFGFIKCVNKNQWQLGLNRPVGHALAMRMSK